MERGKPVVGFFSFTCCEGCEFTVLFLDELLELFDKLDIQYFHLIKEKNAETDFDLAFVEGAISSKHEMRELKRIRAKSKYLVAFGECAAHGGIPAMRNQLKRRALGKYIYSQKLARDWIEVSPISDFVKVDYFMYGCPIIKDEFIQFISQFIKGEKPKEFRGPVCLECPRRGKPDCYMLNKIECLGPITNGGCNALCIRNNMPCTLCRGPLENADLYAEIRLLESFGISKKEAINKIRRFGSKELKESKHGRKNH